MSTLAEVQAPDGKRVRVDYQGRLKQLYFEAGTELAKHVLGSGFTPTEWNEAAADAILTMAAADSANREAKGSAYNDATLEKAIARTETRPVEDLLKFQATLRGITQSGKAGVLAPGARKHLQVARSRFTARIDQLETEQRVFEAAYDKANQPLHRHTGPGGRAAYSPTALIQQGLTENNSRELVAALAEKQGAALEALRGAVGQPNPAGKDDGVSGAFAQSRAALTEASLVYGGAGGYTPFLLQKQVILVPVPAAEYQRRFFEEFAGHVDRRDAAMAPFDTARDGNRKLSPYRDSERERRHAEVLQNPEPEALEPGRTRPNFRFPKLPEAPQPPHGPTLV
jgi:hypothetical protein